MTNITSLLGAEAEFLLAHVSHGIPRSSLHLPGSDFIERVHLRAQGTFQKPMTEGVKLLHAIQDVYLSPQVTIA